MKNRLVIGLWLFVGLAMGVLSFPPPARAGSVCRIVPVGSGHAAIVAYPGKLHELESLMQANEKMEAARCLACLPERGTKIIVTEHGFLSHTIRVLDGKSKGCVGEILSEEVGECN